MKIAIVYRLRPDVTEAARAAMVHSMKVWTEVADMHCRQGYTAVFKDIYKADDNHERIGIIEVNASWKSTDSFTVMANTVYELVKPHVIGAVIINLPLMWRGSVTKYGTNPDRLIQTYLNTVAERLFEQS